MSSTKVFAFGIAAGSCAVAAVYFGYRWFSKSRPLAEEETTMKTKKDSVEVVGGRSVAMNKRGDAPPPQHIVAGSEESASISKHHAHLELRRRHTFVLSGRRVKPLPDVALNPHPGVEAAEFRIPHLCEWTEPLWYQSACPIKPVPWTDVAVYNALADGLEKYEPVFFLHAGPREFSYFHPLETKAAIVTCGGICPGLNTIIRELVMSLRYCYGVKQIFGVQFGFEGFYKYRFIPLEPDFVDDIHNSGGTILGTSRGGHDTKLITDSIEKNELNQVYIIGGDGTHRGAQAIHEEIIRRGLRVSIVGLCKTIDNDIPYLDKTFGFDSAVEMAVEAVRSAHVEIKSCQNGIGLVVLMGRASGYIAMYASLASRDVNVCLIPEDPFELEGPHGLLRFLKERLAFRGHALIVVAEGSGQHLMEATGEFDLSGNPKLPDVGSFLKSKINHYFREEGIPINLKYIDPSYMVRSIPANAGDSIYCTSLSQAAVHGAMAGFGGFTVGVVNYHHVYLPLSKVTQSRRVDTEGRTWQRLLVSTGQPRFQSHEIKPSPSPSDSDVSDAEETKKVNAMME